MYEKILLSEPSGLHVQYETIRNLLTEDAFELLSAPQQELATFALSGCNPHMVILWVTHNADLSVIEALHSGSSLPIVALVPNDQIALRIAALERGADDAISYPLDKRELLARIKAVLRRCLPASKDGEATTSETLRFENMEISLSRYELRIRGEQITLPPKELQLLYFLASNKNKVFSRDQLLNKIWGFDYLGDSRTVDVHIKRVREKVTGVSNRWALKTVWGVGYKFEALDVSSKEA